ncbi:glycosyltransferase family 4 protein [Psychroflexus sp. YR1-1]|uniref:Glycosyltransferase family 4 protein n=1 Tax=Psychroflexus aurantiacus TaxID=2709310 RepID=A0A6B3R8E8_9FLAO|nr:glycosyltransferase family 4 protein [Psychroflexus aurantiacus]NEV93931.1 glycosyltransferase family 4 protein [Psychroflexus aurantiacus]
MKIAFLTPEYPHPSCNHSAGIGTSIYNLSRALLQLKQEVRVLVYGQNKDEIFEDKGVTVQKIKNIKFKGFSRWLTQKKIENIIDQLYSEQKIDLVEAPDWTGITSFIQPKKCPVIIKLHGSDAYFCNLEGRTLKKKNFYHERRSLQKADGHLAVSDFVAKKTNAFFKMNLSVTTVYNGVDLSEFGKNQKTEIPNHILYVGTLIRKKGVLDLAHIFNRLIQLNPEATLNLIGGDTSDSKTGSPSTWKLMQNILNREALENTIYHGQVPYKEVKTYLASTAVCVFPSHAEAFPVSWLEAMAMGKAIVASNEGWSNEMIRDGEEGILVDPSKHDEFAENITYLLENQGRRNQMGQQALHRVRQKFSNERIAQCNLKFYQQFSREA